MMPLSSKVVAQHDWHGNPGLQTLERSYLLRVNGAVVERPQHMLMRVAVGIHKEDLASAIQTYHLLSERWFTHASPTLFNAGTPRPQLSSCFLICMKVRRQWGLQSRVVGLEILILNRKTQGASVRFPFDRAELSALKSCLHWFIEWKSQICGGHHLDCETLSFK